MTQQDIQDIFNSEFEPLLDKFTIIEEYLSNLAQSTNEFIYHPGVYVFFLETEVIKVGRSLTNSRKRALEHIKDNTKNEAFEMNSLQKMEAKVMLFNLKNADDYHWLGSVEMYLERRLNPVIKSGRKG